jgi:hypothetical protein
LHISVCSPIEEVLHMRRSPVTLGVLAAELAVGALVLAPPAAAGDEPVSTEPAPDAPVTPPVAEPTRPPLISVRTGRSGDPNAVTPAVRVDVPVGDPPVDEPSTPAAPEPTPEPEPPTPSSAPPPAAAGVPTSPESPSPTTPTAAGAPPAHTVVEGDSLWHISAAHLATVTGRDRATIPVAEIAGYWVRVCETNRATLRSGNLDLIHPGEVIHLPVL